MEALRKSVEHSHAPWLMDIEGEAQKISVLYVYWSGWRKGFKAMGPFSILEWSLHSQFSKVVARSVNESLEETKWLEGMP